MKILNYRVQYWFHIIKLFEVNKFLIFTNSLRSYFNKTNQLINQPKNLKKKLKKSKKKNDMEYKKQ